MKKQLLVPIFLTALVGLLSIAGSFFLWVPDAFAATAASAGPVVLDAEVWKWGFITAALSTGLSSLGAAYAVGVVGTAAMGAMTEKPELFGRLLIFVGLAEGIAIYGVIISVLILDKII
ncbi:MAG: H+transporting two-sector ATPase C subunit [Gammaproteobacteria bacterium]|nr:H+transporting two-sector ATPase C subunit [Gammaproteobacteria bacterium]MBT3725018.1 H+transporting two-sector ATPase C subunit [Gammaproteobacteria bacterium]MBT4075081.1 H+transporting two-sector ATPase C subunit [Gammaproteobacteria bacterium]MBT4193858.1 H+transporting two-sector ATPase C subunit [Gammaproteobacteria bacterium]MBT4449729.1 H+transporting two-sector ATPase C subunit [Gammaproteobacteria bacterium]